MERGLITSIHYPDKEFRMKVKLLSVESGEKVNSLIIEAVRHLLEDKDFQNGVIEKLKTTVPFTVLAVQMKAHKMVLDAIAKGVLKPQPCEKCGWKKNVDAHHDDYSKPLEVRWLCRKHHQIHHKNQKHLRNREPKER